jgi:hypothetical protein
MKVNKCACTYLSRARSPPTSRIELISKWRASQSIAQALQTKRALQLKALYHSKLQSPRWWCADRFVVSFISQRCEIDIGVTGLPSRREILTRTCARTLNRRSRTLATHTYFLARAISLNNCSKYLVISNIVTSRSPTFSN